MTIAKKLGYTLAIAAVSSLPFGAQAMKNSIKIAMTLEPPGLDPRANAAAAIGQIALYNIYENLVHINQDATFSPMLAKSWTVSDDGLVYTFNLLKGVKFHDGSDFTSTDVKYTFEANAAKIARASMKWWVQNATFAGGGPAGTGTEFDTAAAFRGYGAEVGRVTAQQNQYDRLTYGRLVNAMQGSVGNQWLLDEGAGEIDYAGNVAGRIAESAVAALGLPDPVDTGFASGGIRSVLNAIAGTSGRSMRRG